MNDQHVTVRYVLRTGERLQLAWKMFRSKRDRLCQPPMALDIIYEDDAMIVINKPPAVPTHPSHGHYTDTLANGLAAYFARKVDRLCFAVLPDLTKTHPCVVIVAKDAPAARGTQCTAFGGTISEMLFGSVGG